MAEYTLHYWPIRARNWAILSIARYGDFPLDWKKDTGADYYKEHSPFGQLPLLTGPDGFAVSFVLCD
jgi:glutathione S-transferase